MNNNSAVFELKEALAVLRTHNVSDWTNLTKAGGAANQIAYVLGSANSSLGQSWKEVGNRCALLDTRVSETIDYIIKDIDMFCEQTFSNEEQAIKSTSDVNEQVDTILKDMD